MKKYFICFQSYLTFNTTQSERTFILFFALKKLVEQYFHTDIGMVCNILGKKIKAIELHYKIKSVRL